MFDETIQQTPSLVPDEAISQFRDGSRFWIQRVAVPVITVIGMFGNTITIIIMTRRGMRSTTNLYLAALALCDMLYLVLTFLLGLEHYPNMAAPEYYLYWKLKPYLMMSTDACSNTSVWLTVTFTIERYIAVKYPMKGKVWCTESRAKMLILTIFIVGISFATPVPFEWEVIKKYVINSNTQQIQDGTNNMIINEEQNFRWALDYSEFGKNDIYKTIYYRSTAAIFYIIPLILLIYFNGCLISSVHRSKRERSGMTAGTTRRGKLNERSGSIPTPKVILDISMNGENVKIDNNLKLPDERNGEFQDSYNEREQHKSNMMSIDHKSSSEKDISSSQTYTSQSNVPIKQRYSNSDVTTLIESNDINVHINCDTEFSNKDKQSNDLTKFSSKESSDYVVERDSCSDTSKIKATSSSNNNSARSSPSKRFFRNLTLTNSHGYYQSSHNQNHLGVPHASQERRITIMLISVVILFLCCQLPSAMMILYTATRELKTNSNEHALVLAFGNIFNFLMAVNAAGNFILYSLLSKKYRVTFMKLFCNCFKRKNSTTTNHNGRNFSVRFETLGNTFAIKTSKRKKPISNNSTKLDTLV